MPPHSIKTLLLLSFLAALSTTTSSNPYTDQTHRACLSSYSPACEATSVCTPAPTGPCSPRAIRDDVCAFYPGRDACAEFRKECPGGVKDEDYRGIAFIPDETQVRKAVKGVCQQMPGMGGCKDCGDGLCERPFAALVRLCGAMPMMGDCKVFLQMCAKLKEEENAVLGAKWKCPSSKSREDKDDVVPPMRMFLHFGILEYVLFSWWIPQSVFSLGFACLIWFAAAFGSTALRVHRAIKESQKEWKEGNVHLINHPEQSLLLNMDSSDAAASLQPKISWIGQIKPPKSYKINAQRAVLTMSLSFLDYAIMLVVMTFNIWLIASVVMGLGCGEIVFGHVLAASRSGSATSSTASCCGE